MSDSNLPKSRNVSVRLDEDRFDAVLAIGRVESQTMGAVIRDAIDAYVQSKMQNADWTGKVKEAQEQLQRLLPPDPAQHR